MMSLVRVQLGEPKRTVPRSGAVLFCSLKRIQKQGHIVFARKLQYESHRFMLIFRCVLSAIHNVTWFESSWGSQKRKNHRKVVLLLLVSTAGTHGRCISKCEAFTTLYGNGCRRRCERPKAIGTWFEVRRGAKKNSSTKWGCSFFVHSSGFRSRGI